MATTRISTDHPDLAPVLGPLGEQQRAEILALLEAADARLASVHTSLAEADEREWRSDGIVLETAPSGQTSIDVVIEESTGKITFAAQLRPRNFFPTEAGMWQPGRPPLAMATDAWDVDGGVSIRFKTRVAGRPYTIQQQVAEIQERRYEDPLAAVEGFVAACTELAELAGSREATVDAWKPEEPAAEGPGGVAPAASI
jgi:hypothetical protein